VIRSQAAAVAAASGEKNAVMHTATLDVLLEGMQTNHTMLIGTPELSYYDLHHAKMRPGVTGGACPLDTSCLGHCCQRNCLPH